MAMFPMTFDDP